MNKTEKIIVLTLIILSLTMLGVFCFFIEVFDCPECNFGSIPLLFGSIPCWDCDGTGKITITQWIQNSLENT